ncbi:MAG: MFS transporter [bacterium]|nr:MFS transporter [bacterium]
MLFQVIFYLVSLLAEIPAGYIGDVFPRKIVLLFSYLLYMVRIILWIISPNYWTILLGEVFYGLSKAFYRGTSDGYIYDYLKQSNCKDIILNKYSKFEFFMSIGTATSCLIGAWLYKYIGFNSLLFLELFCNIVAVITLLFIPNIPQQNKKHSFSKHIKRMKTLITTSISSKKLSTYFIYSGILYGITSVFVWNFQFLMNYFALSSIIFGVIYFINHLLRSFGALCTSKTFDKIKLPNLGFFVYVLYLICFLLIIYLLMHGNKYFCVFALVFVCIAIGIEHIFNIGNIFRIHSLISSNVRATISSVNNMFSGLFAVIFLLFFKLIINHCSNLTAFIIFTLLFAFSAILVKKMYTEV